MVVGAGEKWGFLERERRWREVMREGEKRDGGGEVVVVLMMSILSLIDLMICLECWRIEYYLVWI